MILTSKQFYNYSASNFTPSFVIPLSNVARIRGILRSTMPTQVVYQTNADWYQTREAIVNNPLMKSDTTEKGLIKFWFKSNPTLFMLSPNGKLQVKWNNLNEKKTLYRLVQNLLVAKLGEKLTITPLKQQTWIEYPVPESFKLYWCDKVSEFILKKEANANDEKGSAISFRKVVDLSAAEIGAAEIINLAGWLLWKKKGEKNLILQKHYKQAVKVASESSFLKAQEFANNYPELAAQITVSGIDWPTMLKARWELQFRSEPPVPTYWPLKDSRLYKSKH